MNPINSLGRTQSLRLLVVVLGLLILAIGFSWGININQKNAGDISPSPTPDSLIKIPSQPVSSDNTQSKTNATLVYGLWSPGVVEVRTVNDDGSFDHPITKLPAKIKDIHVLNRSEVLYLSDTDSYDHAKRIETINTATLETKIIAEAEPNWGIDDVIVSPDKTYIAWWEVKFAAESKILLGGDSKVHLLNLDTGKSSMVIQEHSDKKSPIHYPLFFDRQNKLYLDTFKPNTGRGFYLGVSSVTPQNPTQLNPVEQLSQGKFSSHPLLIPNQNKIVFIGFDSKAEFILDQKIKEDPKRLELDNPNQIVLLDLDSFSEKVIADSSLGKIYSDLSYSADGSKSFYTIYHWSLPTGTIRTVSSQKQLGVYDNQNGSFQVYSNLLPIGTKVMNIYGNQLLLATLEKDSLGNLGENYTETISKLASFDLNSNKSNFFYQRPKTQIIDLLSAQTRDSLNLLGQTTESNEGDNLKSTQLGEVIIPQSQNEQIVNRLDSQNDNKTDPECDPNKTTNPDNKDGNKNKDGIPPGCRCRNLCPDLHDQKGDNWKDICRDQVGKCYDSPLYLYPETTTNVVIQPKVSNRVYYSKPGLISGSWKLRVDPKGIITDRAGITYNKVDYNYFSSDYSPPGYGLVATQANLNQTLNFYARSLGLNEKETKDFVSFWEEELTHSLAPYYLISHYPAETASKIMSFEINPTPQTFLQVIMYLKPLQLPISIPLPTFNQIPPRKGFTAVDWSGKIEP